MFSIFRIIIFFGTFYLLSCKAKPSLQKSQQRHIAFTEVAEDSVLNQTIAPYKKQISLQMSKQLVYCSGALTKEGFPSSLGMFVCDALSWAYDSVFSDNSVKPIVLVNKGGIRTNLNTGTVTVNALFEIMPFDNEMELVEISGKELLNICKQIMDREHPFAGIHIKARGKQLLQVRYNGKEIKDEEYYHLLTSDYLVAGGDNFTFGKTAVKSIKQGMKIRDALIYYSAYLGRQHKEIKPYTDDRLEIAK